MSLLLKGQVERHKRSLALLLQFTERKASGTLLFVQKDSEYELQQGSALKPKDTNMNISFPF